MMKNFKPKRNKSNASGRRISEDELRVMLRGKPHLLVESRPLRAVGDDAKPTTKAPKFRNTKMVIDGMTFDSTKEAKRYSTLVVLQKTGQISDLRHHASFPIVINSIKVCAYEADFTYKDHTGKLVVEDVKSVHTRTLPVYRLKAKLMKAVHDIDIIEV